uniref:UDP-glycosyltransferase n=1 Tax=Polygala tenuifolia TaxID=355332 RepID=A0A4P2X5T8_9FABA|nr:UDP-glycosyltransferase [Polygala tenuifolia]
MAGVDEKLHIVMFPWLAFGHMIPYLELAKLIAQKGNRVSFVSTPRNIDRLPKLSPNVSIEFVKLPLPKVDNLPENAEATSDLPYDVVPLLKKAYDSLEEPMRKFLQSSNPDWVLYDFAPYWVGKVGAEMGIKTCFFSICNAASLGFLGPPKETMGDGPIRTQPEQFLVSPEWVPFPSPIRFRYFEVMKIAKGIIPSDNGVSDIYRFGASAQNCDIVSVRSCYEFEPEWLDLTQTIYGKPVIPVGELPTTDYNNGDDDNETWLLMNDWLDQQKKGTVVYIAFGTESKPTQEELNEIALGLEKSELPFFWVFRARCGEYDPNALKLPDGFEKRTKGRGLVWTSWAPQLKIIAHEAIGVFLSHSGWSSVVEAIQFEKSLVLLTCLADQGINASVLEEKKMAYSIPRDEHDGSITSDDVAESLKLVLFKEEGKIYRERIKEMKEIFVNKERQDSYVNSFLNYLRVNKKT